MSKYVDGETGTFGPGAVYGSGNNAPQVGFEPGPVQGRNGIYSKNQYQRKLATELYGKETREFIDQHPWRSFIYLQCIYAFPAGWWLGMMWIFAGWMINPETNPVQNSSTSASDTMITWVIVLLVMAGIGVWAFLTKTVRLYYQAKQYAAWLRSPEGQAWLHQKYPQSTWRFTAIPPKVERDEWLRQGRR